MNLERKYGPWSLRVWWLIVNLGANTLALYGLAGWLHDGSHLLLLAGGLLLTFFCIWVLSAPFTMSGEDRTPEDRK